MGYFVSHNGGQLSFAGKQAQHAPGDEHKPAGSGKGVDLRAVQELKMIPGKDGMRGIQGQGLPELVQVNRRRPVFARRITGKNLRGHSPSEIIFLLCRQFPVFVPEAQKRAERIRPAGGKAEQQEQDGDCLAVVENGEDFSRKGRRGPDLGPF